MYCYRCGEWKTRRICPVCGADESRRAEARTAEGRALRMLFDLQEAGPAGTIGNAQAFASYLTDLLPGDANELFRQQLVMIVGYYDVRALLLEQLRSRTAPDSAAYADICSRAEQTGFAPATCRKAISVLYEMIGWEIPQQQDQPAQKQAQLPQQPAQIPQQPVEEDKPGIPAFLRRKRDPKPVIPPPPAQLQYTAQFKPAPQPPEAINPLPVPQPQFSAMLKPVIPVGSIVRFGHYPQTAAGNDRTPIEWLVLDVQGKQALLLSRYGLDAKPYNVEHVPVTWETCTLRKWMNDSFLNAAFSADERRAILTAVVDNSRRQGLSFLDKSGGNVTWDSVFLLSAAEAGRYFGWASGAGARLRAAPTLYAVRQGASVSRKAADRTAEGAAAGWWWLRSPGFCQNFAAHVNADGTFGDHEVRLENGMVRPAMWINPEAAHIGL